MKVNILLNLGLNEFGDDAYAAGIHDVPEPLAQNLIGRKLAVRVDEVSIKAVAASTAAIADAQPVTVKHKSKPSLENKEA